MSNSQNSSNYAANEEEEEEEEEEDQVDFDEVVNSGDSNTTSIKMDAGDRANVSRKAVADCMALRKSGLGQLDEKKVIAKKFMDLLYPTSSSSGRQAVWRKKNERLLSYLCSQVPKISTALFDKITGPKLAKVLLPMAEALQSWVDQNPDSPLPLDCEPLFFLFNLYELALDLIMTGQDVPRTLAVKSKLMPYSNVKTTPANKAEGICCCVCGHGNMVYTISPGEVEKENTKRREEHEKRVREQEQAVKKMKEGFVAKKIPFPKILFLTLQCQCSDTNCFGMTSNNS
jgi:hypothetical protein